MTEAREGQVAKGPTIFVVDDDEAMRRALEFLMASVGHRVRSFASANDFLSYYRPAMHGCLITDVRMPEMSGEVLHQRMCEAEYTLPVILMTAYATVPMAIRAMHAGVFDFIEKPFDDQALLDRINRALRRDAETRLDRELAADMRRRYASLTPREREVMQLVVAGLMNREIANMLRIGVKTVEDHRGRVMQKMAAHTLADLVRMGTALGLD